MANYYLTRNPSGGGWGSNVDGPSATYNQITLTYGGVTGGQDVILAPDIGPFGVAIQPVGSTYSLEVSMDAPANVLAGSATWIPWSTALTGATTAQVAKIECVTAIRLNPSVGGTSTKLNVRA
jgi:hypothetical protein